MQKILDRPDWAPLLIIWKRYIITTKGLIKFPLQLSCAICASILGTCICFGRICESRGLSNLTPARSRLFKLIGEGGAKRWSCNGNKHIWWLTCANESEKRSNGTNVI